jgi:hypothetical protein
MCNARFNMGFLTFQSMFETYSVLWGCEIDAILMYGYLIYLNEMDGQTMQIDNEAIWSAQGASAGFCDLNRQKIVGLLE